VQPPGPNASATNAKSQCQSASQGGAPILRQASARAGPARPAIRDDRHGCDPQHTIQGRSHVGRHPADRSQEQPRETPAGELVPGRAGGEVGPSRAHKNPYARHGQNAGLGKCSPRVVMRRNSSDPVRGSGLPPDLARMRQLVRSDDPRSVSQTARTKAFIIVSMGALLAHCRGSRRRLAWPPAPCRQVARPEKRLNRSSALDPVAVFDLSRRRRKHRRNDPAAKRPHRTLHVCEFQSGGNRFVRGDRTFFRQDRSDVRSRPRGCVRAKSMSSPCKAISFTSPPIALRLSFADERHQAANATQGIPTDIIMD